MTSNNDAARGRAARAEEEQLASPEFDLPPLSTLAEDDQARSFIATAAQLKSILGTLSEDLRPAPTSMPDENPEHDAVAPAVTNDVQPTTRQSINKVQQLVTAMHRDQGEIDVLKRNTRRILKKLAAE